MTVDLSLVNCFFSLMLGENKMSEFAVPKISGFRVLEEGVKPSFEEAEEVGRVGV